MNQELLHQLFEYVDGELYWKVSRGKAKVGKMAGSIDSGGYKQLNYCSKPYSIHRLIFLMHHGYMPKMVDHINGIRSDNRIENLREADNRLNQYNAKKQPSTSGAKNVHWDDKSKEWRVRININGKRTQIGRFADLELAELIAIEARDKYHKEFARHE